MSANLFLYHHGDNFRPSNVNGCCHSDSPTFLPFWIPWVFYKNPEFFNVLPQQQDRLWKDFTNLNYNIHDIYIQYDRLRSTLRTLKLASTDVNLKSQFDLMIFSNRHLFQILRSVVDLVVRVSDVIGRWFEKLRNVLRFEKWTPF